MNTEKITKLKAMINKADFLESATKQVFLDKIPHLPQNKLQDLYEIFEHDLTERNKLKERKIEIFEKYKATVNGIYNHAKQIMQNLKEKAATKLEEHEMKTLNRELSQL